MVSKRFWAEFFLVCILFIVSHFEQRKGVEVKKNLNKLVGVEKVVTYSMNW